MAFPKWNRHLAEQRLDKFPYTELLIVLSFHFTPAMFLSEPPLAHVSQNPNYPNLSIERTDTDFKRQGQIV